jgi:hypothetical protein
LAEAVVAVQARPLLVGLVEAQVPVDLVVRDMAEAILAVKAVPAQVARAVVTMARATDHQNPVVLPVADAPGLPPEPENAA